MIHKISTPLLKMWDVQILISQRRFRLPCIFEHFQTLPADWVKLSPKHSGCEHRMGYQAQPIFPFLPSTDTALSPTTSCLKNCTTGNRKAEMKSYFGAGVMYRKKEHNIQSKYKAKEVDSCPVLSPEFMFMCSVLVNTRCIKDKF